MATLAGLMRPATALTAELAAMLAAAVVIDWPADVMLEVAATRASKFLKRFAAAVIVDELARSACAAFVLTLAAEIAEEAFSDAAAETTVTALAPTVALLVRDAWPFLNLCESAETVDEQTI